jgi:hypothetical protein
MLSTDDNGIRLTALPGIHILGQKRGVHVMSEQEVGEYLRWPVRSNLPAHQSVERSLPLASQALLRKVLPY